MSVAPARGRTRGRTGLVLAALGGGSGREVQVDRGRLRRLVLRRHTEERAVRGGVVQVGLLDLETGVLQRLAGVVRLHLVDPGGQVDHLAGLELRLGRAEGCRRLALQAGCHGGLVDPPGVARAGAGQVGAGGGEPDALQRLGVRVPVRVGLVDGDHRRTGELRGVADEPDTLVAVGGAGLAGLVVEAADPRRPAGAVRGHALQDLVHLAGDAGVHRPLAVRGRGRQRLAVDGGHRADDDRVAVDAAGGEGRHRLGHRHRGHLGHAEDEGRRAVEVVHDVAAGGLLDADLLRHPGGVADAGVADQLDVERVDRPVGGRLQVHRRRRDGRVGDRPRLTQHERAAAGSERRALEAHRGIGRVRLVAGDALLQGGRQGEDLERRACLVALGATHRRGRVVVVERLAAAVAHRGAALRHRLDLAGARLDHHHRPQRRVPVRHHGRHRLLGGLLDPRVDGGPDGEPATVEHPLAILDGRAERGRLQQLVDGVLTDERVAARRAAVARRAHRRRVELGRLGLIDLVLQARVELGHPVQHHIAALDRGLRVQPRVVRVGALHQAGEHRRLGQVEILRGLVEEVSGSGLDAVRAVAVVRDVQVALEDLVLGQPLLQGDRIAHLLDLAAVRLLLGLLDALLVATGQRGLDLDPLDVLLGDRRAALGGTAGAVAEERADGALHIDRAVLVEAVVLDVDLGLLHHRGDLVQRDVDAVLVVEGGEGGAVRHQQGRPLRLGWGLEVRRQVLQAGRSRLQGRGGDADPRHDEAGGEHADQDAHDQKGQDRLGVAAGARIMRHGLEPT
ncbi:hypothetical protein SDC9_49489 [bioreactor metagenome]|uniref:NAD-specific glutamate dehydrogenase n=1 Tax=bioreactor metagenome TaxID=1076179 RepID=A0A644WH71_9ZZZZ